MPRRKATRAKSRSPNPRAVPNFVRQKPNSFPRQTPEKDARTPLPAESPGRLFRRADHRITSYNDIPNKLSHSFLYNLSPRLKHVTWTFCRKSMCGILERFRKCRSRLVFPRARGARRPENKKTKSTRGGARPRGPPNPPANKETPEKNTPRFFFSHTGCNVLKRGFVF
jgi:hypothetical protein